MQPCPSEIWIKNLLSIAPPIGTRPSFPFSQSLLSGSFHKPIIFIHQKASKQAIMSCLTLCDPWTVVYQASLSIGFSRQEYWSGLPFPSPEDLPYPGIEPRSPTLQADALASEPPGKKIGWKPQSQKINQTDHMDHSLVWFNETISHVM